MSEGQTAQKPINVIFTMIEPYFMITYSSFIFCLLGTGIEPDPLEAAKLFRDLADDGHSYAQVL